MAYTTTAEVKTYLGIDSSNDDTLLSDLIDRAQAAIDAHTRRTFKTASASTRTFDAIADVEAGLVLWLDADLCAITSITNGDSVAVSGSEYVTQPRNSAPYYALRLKLSAGKLWTYDTDPENAISVTGKWAYSEAAPADIEQATIYLAAWMYRQKDTFGGETDRPLLTGDGVTIMPSSWPKVVRELLQPYRRLV